MSEKALELVRQLKHLPGKHPQKLHGGGSGGSEAVSPEVELRNNLESQMGSSSSKSYAVVLSTEGSRPTPVFVRRGRVINNKPAVLHINKLIKVDTPSGKSWGVHNFKLTGASKLVDEGFDTISVDQAKTWIQDHKAGANAGE